jgi:hypothetical protein
MIPVAPSGEKEWRAMLAFLHERGVKLQPNPDLRMLGGISDDYKALRVVVAYDAFCANVCQMHVAGDGSNWMTRRLLWAAFDYPFNQAKCVEVFGLVPGNNYAALRLNFHLGFKKIHTVKSGWETGVDLVIMSMRKEDCKWLALGRKKDEHLQAA